MKLEHICIIAIAAFVVIATCGNIRSKNELHLYVVSYHALMTNGTTAFGHTICKVKAMTLENMNRAREEVRKEINATSVVVIAINKLDP